VQLDHRLQQIHKNQESFLFDLAFGQVQYFKLISRNWRARQARSYTFGITLSTEQGCASFWKNSLCRGRLNYFHFFEDLSIGSGHFDWFSLLISRNWRARQDCSFTFGITLSTEQDCPLSLKDSWLSDLMFCDYLRDKHLEVSSSLGVIPRRHFLYVFDILYSCLI